MLMQEERIVTTTVQKPASLIHFVISRTRLNQGLTTINHAVSRSRMDIEKMALLGCIRLEVKDGFLVLSATNLEISITTRLELTEKNEEEQEGVVAVPAKLLTDLIANAPEGTITISVAHNYMLRLKHGRGQAHIKCQSSSEYFSIPNADDGEMAVVLPIGSLREVVREVSVAVAKDDAFPVLTCLFVHVENTKIVFAATDRYRTAHRPLQLPTESGVAYDLLIPKNALSELSSILPAEGMVTMSVTPNNGQVIFHTQWVTFSSRLLEGTFPNYAALIPKKEDRQTRVVVKVADFKEIVRLAAIYANADSSSGIICLGIKGSLGMEPGVLTVASEPTEMGDGHNSIIAVVEGEDQEPITFTCYLVLDALNAMPSTADVVFEIGMMKGKTASGEIVGAPAGILKTAGTHTCIHSFMSTSTR